jgi:RelA/SpoT family (p)ppGpp synthetase
MNETEIPLEPVYSLPLETYTPYGKNVQDDLNTLITDCSKYINNVDLALVTKAFYFCVDNHKAVFRRSGELYYSHPYKVALSVMRIFKLYDFESVAAALLHDTIEDVLIVTPHLVEEKFGADVSKLVDGVTKIKGTDTRSLDKAATYGKLFLTLIKDIRAIYIKLADRLDNMKSLYHLSRDRQKAIASETLYFYTPFAQRLGLTQVRREFEDLSLYFIDSEAFSTIRDSLEEKGKIFVDYIRVFFRQIEQKLTENHIQHVITIDHKHVYEIYKMLEEGRSLANIDNFYSIVITLDTEDFSECYRTYGLIASVFGPVSSLYDYIARPKINLYRALHSSHLGPGRKLVEVIIRTKQMDRIAVEGIATQASLLHTYQALDMKSDDVVEWVEWMQDIIEENDEDAIQKIWGSIRLNLYDDFITVHLKDYDAIKIPKGSCAIDLAFRISEETAYHIISVKINGEVHNLDYELKDNDYVEIISSPNMKPDPDWEHFVITHKAIVKLHKYFKNYQPSDETEVSTEKANLIELKLKIFGDDRPRMLHDITKELGQINIQRINIASSNSIFEGIFTITITDKSQLNSLFTNLLSIKGLKGVERIDDDNT